MAAGSTLVLQGTNSDDPNNPVAQNWEVQALLPSLSTDTYINIWAAKGSNGILTVTVPSDGVVYSIYVANSDADDLGFVTVGGLRIQISNGVHLMINSPQTVNVVVDDTPSSMDLVISATPSSLVTLQKTSSPVFLLNTAATIQPAVLGGSNVVYFYGGSFLNIDGSQVPQVNFADGMVSVFKQTNSAISTWFAQQLTAANVPSNPLPASVVVGILKCNNISVNSAFVSATGTGMFVPSTTTYFEALVNAQLLLTDNTAWVNSKISGSILTVDSRYKLTMVGYLSQTATLVFNSASHTNFVVQCDTPATFLTNWWLHNDTTSKNYTWQGPACNGYISLNIPTPAIQFVGQVSNVNLALMSYVPVTPAVSIQFTGQVSNVNLALLSNVSSLIPSVAIQFAGQGLTNVNLALLGNVSALTPRSVTVTGRSLAVDAKEATLSLLTDATHQLMINTVVAQSINNIFVNYTTSSQSSGTFGPDSCSSAQPGAATMLVSDLTNQLKLCVATINDGSLAVYDSITWSQASVNSSLLIVDQRYHLLLVDWHNTLFYANPTAATILTVLCGVPSLSNQFTMWKLAGDTPGMVSWTGASCGGTINSNAYPKLFFAGSGNPITATIQLPSSSVPLQRTTSINNSTVSLTTSEVPPLVITTDTTSQLLVLFDFTTQTNATSTVQMNYPAVPNGVINTNVPSTCLSPYITSGQSIFGITSTSDNTVYCFAVAGDVILSDPQQWTHTTVQGGNLNVADRYLFSILGGPNTVLGGKIATFPVVSGSTLLEITCGSYIISNQSVHSNASATSLTWNSQSCNGAINVNTPPLVLFSGPGQTGANLAVDDSADTRSVVLQDSQITVSSTAFTQIETSNHPLYLTLALRGGINNVVSNYSQSASIASATQYRGVCTSNTATAKVLLSNSADTITQCITVNGNGNMVLRDPYDWQNVSISASVLTVPGRYQLELLTYSGLVLDPLVSSRTALTITCAQCSTNGCPVTGAVWWNVGGSDAQQFSWNSTYCGGALVTDVYPVIQFTGVGSTNVKTNFTVATSAYNNVVMNAQSLNISASADNSSLLTMSTDNQHQLSVLSLLSQDSELQLLQTTGNSNIDSSAALGICRGFSSSSTVFVSTGLANTLQLCLVTKLLSVVDTLPWTNINLVADVLTVPSRYQLNLVGTDVTFFPLISSTTLLEITCGQATANQIAAWNIQNYSPATVYPASNLTSTSASCTLAIGGLVLPQLLFSGSGSTVANLNLLVDNVAQRSFNFSAGFFQVTSDNTQWPILVTTDITHDLQVMVNATQAQNTLVLGYTESQTNAMDTPAILGPCTTASPSSSAGPSVAVSNAGDNSTYCLISTQGTIVVTDYATLPHAIITGFTWHTPQRYRVDLINWDNVFINPPVTSDTMIEVQCGIPSDVQITPYWHMGMNQISNVTWQGTACQGVITNLFPTYNFTGEGSTKIFADLMSSSPEDVVVRQITAGPNSLRVNILPDVANISICSTHPISVALSLTGGANSLMSTYPVSSNNVSFANSSNCVADDSSSAAIFFSNMVDNNTYCMVAYDGLVFVEDMEQWSETEIYSSTLSVPFRYNVELLKWEGVYFLAFTNDSVVNIYCNEPNVTNGLTWRIGTNTTAGATDEVEGPIVWHSASCNGVATNLFPQLIFRENGTSNVTLLVDETFVPASITLNTLSLFTSAPYAYLATDGVQIINLDMLIEAQGTELILDRTPANEFVPRLEAEDPVKISSVRESSVTLSGKLKFHVDTSSIESNPLDSSETSCLAPHLQCQSVDFVDMKILGASPCITKTHFSDCFTESVLFINTNYSLTCSSPSDTTQWSLSVVSSPQETHYADAWLFYVVIAVFGYGVFCFVVGLCIGPALINAGVLEVAILASLRHVKNLLTPYWNLKIRILVMSGYEVAYNLFTGWFCFEDARIPFFGDMLHVIPVYVAIGLSGFVILLISFVLITRIPVWDRIREKRVPAWLDNHLHWFIHVINVVVALATWLVPFAISHATLQKPYAYEILLSILLIPLIIGLARCIHFKIAPLSMFIPLIVLPALSRDDVPTPWLVIFSLAAASIILNTVSATLRRLPLCSSIPDKRPAQIQAIDNRLYPYRRFNVWLFSCIIPLRAFGDLVGLGFLFTMLFFPHFFTVILWLIWAGISMLAGTLELLPAVVASLRRNKEEPEVIQHSGYVPVAQDPRFDEDPDLAYPRYGTNAIVDDYSADNTHNNDGNESDASSEIFEDPNTSYSLNK